MSEHETPPDHYCWTFTLESAGDIYELGAGSDEDYSQALLDALASALDDDHFDVEDEFYDFQVEMITGTVHQFIDDDRTDDLAQIVGEQSEKLRDLGELEFYRGQVCPLCEETVPTEVPEWRAEKGLMLRLRVAQGESPEPDAEVSTYAM